MITRVVPNSQITDTLASICRRFSQLSGTDLLMKHNINLDEFIPTFINNYYELRNLDRQIANYFFLPLCRGMKRQKIRINVRNRIIEEVKEIMGKNIALRDKVRETHSPLKSKPPTWGQLINKLKNRLYHEGIDEKELIEDCQASMVHRMYQIGMGNVQPGFHELSALTTLLNNSVAETENIMELIEDEGETYNLDSAEGINRLATRVVTLFLEGYLSLRTAERTFNILQKKITFSETAHLLPTFEERKTAISENNQTNLVGQETSEEDDLE